MLTLLLIGLVTLAFSIQPAKATPKTIIVPDNYPTIQAAIDQASQGDTLLIRSGTYYEHIVVNKTLTIQGEGKYFPAINGNNTGDAVEIESSSVKISGLRISNGYFYDAIIDAANSTILDCILTGSASIYINSSQNTIRGNLLDNCTCAIVLNDCAAHDNSITGNTICNCQGGRRSSTTIVERFSVGNLFYHNNFIHDRWYWADQIGANNMWFNNESREGNYWDNVLGNDTNGDGIIDGWNTTGVYGRDYYPLANPYWCPSDVNHDVAVTNAVLSKAIVRQGYSLNINVTATDPGDFTETFNVTLYANNTAIVTQTVTLASGNSTTIAFTWDTAGFAKGGYTIRAYASILSEETHRLDNSYSAGIVQIYAPDGGPGRQALMM
jgi:hypothetical protein